jgi:hypothetical protein
VSSAFVKDVGDIPEEEKFEYPVACPTVHPGLCRVDDALYMPVIEQVTRAARRYLRSCKIGSPHVFAFHPENHVELDMVVEPDMVYTVRAHLRGSKPAVALLAAAAWNESDRTLTHVKPSAGLYKYSIDLSFFGVAVKRCWPLGKVTVQSLAYDKSILRERGDVLAILEQDAIPVDIFPTPP